jgi:hypothetical protein
VALLVWLICSHVVYDAIGQAPLDEVELGDGRRQALKLYALGPTKGIEELFRVSVETRLVGHVDGERTPGRSRVRDVSILGVIGDEPLQITQRNTLTFSREDVVQPSGVDRVLVEAREGLEQQVRLAH